MSNLSTKKSPNPKSAAAPKRTSATSNQAPRRKTASIAIAAEAPPQIEKSKAEHVAAANRKTQPEAVQTSPEGTEALDPQRKPATKPEHALTLLSKPEAEKPKASDKPVATAVERPKAAEAQHEEFAAIRTIGPAQECLPLCLISLSGSYRKAPTRLGSRASDLASSLRVSKTR